jgi:preprotein translocase subunit SecG
MIGLLVAVHVIACVLLIIIILIQAGRGGGLVENFSGVESMFGPRTSAFLTRSTSVLSVLFFITCLSLAFASARQSRSLMLNVNTQKQNQTTQKETPQQPVAQKEAPGVKESAKPQEVPQGAATHTTASQEPVKQETPINR